MGRATAVHRAIARVEKLLPGKPSHPDDPRWRAMLALQDDFVRSHPEEIWPLVLRWGKHPQTDLRDAVACCLLEHLLEHHFESLFPRIAIAAKASPRFRDTLRRCYWMGKAAQAPNARRLDRLAGVKRPRFHPRKCHLPKKRGRS